DLREAVRAWKQRTGYEWKARTGTQLWQPGFHDRVLREHDDTRSLRYTLAELEEHAGGWAPERKRR
ncbi:MAG TPA: hypothetical protein VFD69_00005, partial [Vicinamibacterales bacterium]|nr:hypothetical protein [Vicinamibacterales bacterium]